MPTRIYQTGVNGDILDATLDEENPTINDGTLTSVQIGFVIPVKQRLAKRAVFAVTMDLPPGVTIRDARFDLSWTDSVVALLPHELRRITDGIVHHPFQESLVTWIDRGFGEFWASPGGDFTDPTVVFVAPGGPIRQSIDVTAFTIDAYENRNQDWWAIIKRQTESGVTDLKKVASSEAVDVAQRPTLTVEYHRLRRRLRTSLARRIQPRRHRR